MSSEPKRPSAFNLYGSWVIFLVLPPFVYYIWICVTQNDGALFVPRTAQDVHWLWAHVSAPTWQSIAIFTGWMCFQGLLQIYAPGPWKQGVALDDGTRLEYRMNGWLVWWFTWACLAAAVVFGWFKPATLYDQFGPLLSTVNLFTYPFCIFLYVLGKASKFTERTSGHPLYDYLMGTSLNPASASSTSSSFARHAPA